MKVYYKYNTYYYTITHTAYFQIFKEKQFKKLECDIKQLKNEVLNLTFFSQYTNTH